MRYSGIETVYGFLNGRDAIHLDEYSRKDNGSLILTGEINCNLASKPPKGEWCPYEIKFQTVMALKITELDTFEFIQSKISWPATSFDRVLDSAWQKSLIGSATPITIEYSEYLFKTYDFVFEVICLNYSLEFGDSRI